MKILRTNIIEEYIELCYDEDFLSTPVVSGHM